MTDYTALKVTEHVIYMDGRAHDALVTKLRPNGNIDLMFFIVYKSRLLRRDRSNVPHITDLVKAGDSVKLCFRVPGEPE